MNSTRTEIVRLLLMPRKYAPSPDGIVKIHVTVIDKNGKEVTAHARLKNEEVASLADELAESIEHG